MTCPDENVFARVQSRLLGAAELAAFHRHLDTCPECLELASLLGCMNTSDQGPILREGAAEVRPGRSSPRPRSERAYAGERYRPSWVALSVTFVCHAYSSVVLMPSLWQAFRADVTQGLLGHWTLRYVWLPFTLAWGSAGLAFATVVLLRSLFMTRPSGFMVRSYAMLSVLTGYLAPIGLCLVFTSEWNRTHR